MKLSRERVGEMSILLESTLWSLFPIVTILSFSTLPPLISLGWSTLFATLFFALILTVRGTWAHVFEKSARRDILFATLILGIAYYVFLFFGLKYTSAGNAGIIMLSEIFFSFCFFHLWRKEKLETSSLIGALLMLVGAGIVLYPNFTHFRLGDFLVLIASMIAPLGNWFQRRARTAVSSEGILFVRSLGTVPVAFVLAYLFGVEVFTLNLSGATYLLLAVNGIVLFGLSKILWIEGIHRISVVKANALASITPFFTLLFASFLLHEVPTFWQLISLIPMLLGLLLLSAPQRKTPAQ